MQNLILLQSGSIISNDEKRETNILKNADLFDVERYPSINITSSSFKALKEKSYKVFGTPAMN